MKKIIILLFIGSVFLMKAQTQTITPSLQTALNNAGPSDMLAITITMSEQHDLASLYQILEGMSREEKRQLVVSELKGFADLSQQSIMNSINGLVSTGQIDNVRELWIVNMIACKAKPIAITQLAQRQDIYLIHVDEIYDVGELEPAINTIPENSPEPPPYHILKMNVPDVWDMGYEGEDVVVAVLDTGVNYDHHDLIGNMWYHPDFPNHGWNFIHNNNDPMDDDELYYHGTHVAGIIAGNGNGSGYDESYKTGVAPKAKIMAVKVLEGDGQNYYFHSTVLAGVQFSVEYGADIINLSLGASLVGINPVILSQWRQAMDVVLSSGRISIAGAGNKNKHSGYVIPPNQIFIPGNIPPPWQHPDQLNIGTQSGVVSVGATDDDDEMWYLSCEGPVTWINIEPYYDYPIGIDLQGGLIRPDVVAPGVEVLSSYNSEGYSYMTGTSMSTAAVSGVMALLLSANPFLLPDELSEIIETTATQLYPHTNKNNETGSGRVNALAAVQMTECVHEFYNNQVLNISISPCDIIVKPGGILTINKNLLFTKNRKIIIEPGGKLIVDGALISGYNNTVWQGIQVWGNKQQSQWPDQYGVMHQGLLEIKNGAIIENAIDAVVLWNPDNYSSTGGVVQANDAVFRNNARAVHALMYWNFNPLNPEERLPNRSYFKNTTFELTEDYHGDEVFSKHVDLFDVFGVDFKACDFTLDPKAKNVSYFNHGIAAYSAGFNLLPVCSDPNTMPCPGYLENTFNGFNRGVSATNALSFSPPFFANRAAFSNNTYGLHVNDVGNFTVINSNFQVGIEDYKGECKSGLGVGIFTDLSTGFAIEENNFTKYMAAPPGDYFGTWINNTLEADEVYKNDFTGLSYANYSEGKNWWRDDRYIGLAYFCNENQSNYADFYVGRNSLNEGGIQSEQGYLNHDAGNTFTQNGATWHFYNDGEHLIGYYHNNSQANKIPDINLLHRVVPYAITYNNSCPSYYGGGGSENPMAMSAVEQQQAEQLFITNLNDYNNVKSLYTSLIDGGNTDGTVFDIQTAHPDDMWALRAQLLGKSPHLSMVVLKEASDRTDVFNDAALFDILAANPDELKKDELITYLEQKEEPLPDYMVNILKQVAEGATYKTVLEQQMAHYNRNKTRAAHNMIRHIVHDSIVDNNLLRQWLNNLGGIQSDKQIIGTFVQEGNYANALALANMLPQLYNLQNDELIAHNDYMAMLNLQHTLQQQGRNLFQLTGAEKQQLDALATGTGTAALQARAILEMVYQEYAEPCPCVGEAGSFKNAAINLHKPAMESLLSVTAKPNPARDWVVFEYQLPGETPEAAIRITDAGGRLIKTLTVTGKQGQQMWDTRGLEPGTYYYTLNKAGEYKSGRIVIHR